MMDDVMWSAGCERILTTGWWGTLRVPSSVCSPVEGQTATTGVGGHSHGLRWTPTFYVGSPSAMAPEWGQTGTRTVPCVWIELGGPARPQLWGSCGATDASAEHEQHAYGHHAW